MLRLFGNGTLGYSPQVYSPLLDALNYNVTYPTLGDLSTTINVKDEIEKAVEDHLYKLQFGPEGNRMDAYLRPWLVGRYELHDIVYDSGRRDDVVITYVGRQRPPVDPRTVLAPTDGGGGAPDPSLSAPRLFDTQVLKRSSFSSWTSSAGAPPRTCRQTW